MTNRQRLHATIDALTVRLLNARALSRDELNAIEAKLAGLAEDRS